MNVYSQFAFSWSIRGVRLLAMLLAGTICSQAAGVERTLRAELPATARAGTRLEIVLVATSNAGGGEQVGFLQADASTDGGRTWSAVCYLEKVGPTVEHRASVECGPAGSTVQLRVRAAFRDGLAGDVDYRGAAIRWQDSWDHWDQPPAKLYQVAVTAR